MGTAEIIGKEKEWLDAEIERNENGIWNKGEDKITVVLGVWSES